MLNVLAGTLTLCAYVPYVGSILSGSTKPNRVSWWIWALVGGLILSTYISGGGEAGIGIAVGAFIGQILVAVLSVRFGTGGASLLDRLCLLGAVAAGAVWYATSSPFLPHAMVVVIDGCALLPTFVKSLRDPDSENMTAWLFWTAGAAVTLLNVRVWSAENTLYPLYLAVSNSLVFLTTLRRYVR